MSEQLSFLPDDPPKVDPPPPPPPKAKRVRYAPDPESPGARLWGEGVGIIRTLTGHDAVAARKLLGRITSLAGNDVPAVLAMLHEARDNPPANPVPWFMAAASTRSATDPWGLTKFFDRGPSSLRQQDWASVSETGIVAIRDIMEATEFPPTWRGSYEPLIAWLVDGYEPAGIARVIANLAAKPMGLTSLRYFDAMVRRYVPRWDPVRLDYR